MLAGNRAWASDEAGTCVVNAVCAQCAGGALKKYVCVYAYLCVSFFPLVIGTSPQTLVT